MPKSAIKPYQTVLNYFKTASVTEASIVLDLVKAEMKDRQAKESAAQAEAAKPVVAKAPAAKPVAAKTTTKQPAPKPAPVAAAPKKKPGPKPGSHRKAKVEAPPQVPDAIAAPPAPPAPEVDPLDGFEPIGDGEQEPQTQEDFDLANA